MGILDTAEADIESILGKIDLPLLISASQSLIAAWPSISADVTADLQDVPAYVADIGKALSGQTPTDTDWAAVDATLDAGDTDIAAAGAAAQAELDKRNGGGS